VRHWIIESSPRAGQGNRAVDSARETA
jgi:hypothetical protein